MRSLNEARARQAAAKAAFFRGETDQHPQGLSGRAWIIPPEETRCMWDWGEYGADAGWDHDRIVGRSEHTIAEHRRKLAVLHYKLTQLSLRMRTGPR
jgi:hypothetical protein